MGEIDNNEQTEKQYQRKWWVTGSEMIGWVAGWVEKNKNLG